MSDTGDDGKYLEMIGTGDSRASFVPFRLIYLADSGLKGSTPVASQQQQQQQQNDYLESSQAPQRPHYADPSIPDPSAQRSPFNMNPNQAQQLSPRSSVAHQPAPPNLNSLQHLPGHSRLPNATTPGSSNTTSPYFPNRYQHPYSQSQGAPASIPIEEVAAMLQAVRNGHSLAPPPFPTPGMGNHQSSHGFGYPPQATGYQNSPAQYYSQSTPSPWGFPPPVPGTSSRGHQRRPSSSSSMGSVPTALTRSRKGSTASNESAITAQSHLTATTTGRGKRKRTEDPDRDESRGQTKDKATVALLAEQVAANRSILEMIQAQHQQIQQVQLELSKIVQNTHHLPNRDQPQDPLAAQADVLKSLLDGAKETNDLLRMGLSLQSQNEVKPQVGNRDDEDAPMSELDADAGTEAAIPVRKKAKKGPSPRDRRDNALAREIRKLFNMKYKGHVSKPESLGNPPDPEHIVLDLDKTPGTPWNRSARRVFVNYVLSANIPAIVELNPSKSEIERFFISNFRSAHLKYVWGKLPEGEKHRRKQLARRKGRKRWLYYRRVRAADRFKETRRHLPMLAAYGPEGMSTDESSHENGTGLPMYLVTNKHWRHPNAAACFRTLDAVHRDSRFLPIRLMGPGAPIHNRLLSDRQSSQPPVRGLPAGLYDPQWLSMQPPVIKQDLEVIPSGDYDFSHDAGIIDLTTNNHGQLNIMHLYT